MTEEVVVQEQTQEAEQAAFEAGFKGAEVEQTPPPEEAKPQEETPAAEATPEAEASDGGAAPEPERNQWGYTDEEMKTLLGKASKVDQLEQQLADERNKIYGKLGEYNRTIKQMQEHTGKSGLSVPQLNNLKAEFPELAELLAKDFGDVATTATVEKAVAEQPAAPVFDESIIDRRVEQATRSLKEELLAERHPDWQEVRDSDEFATYRATLASEVQQKIDSSKDVSFAIRTISAFKDWRDAKQKATQTKQQRLEQAVMPTGISQPAPPALDEEAAFAAAFKAVRGG